MKSVRRDAVDEAVGGLRASQRDFENQAEAAIDEARARVGAAVNQICGLGHRAGINHGPRTVIASLD